MTTLNLLATVRPKEIKKQAPVVNLGTIEGPEEISFSINPPEVEISTPTIREVSFNPVTPVTTTLPSLSTSNIKISSYMEIQEHIVLTTIQIINYLKIVQL